MPLLQLSQSHLTLVEQCPRKFQYIYLAQLAVPTPPEQRVRLNRGSQIHHLMQQQELHLNPNISNLEASTNDSTDVYQMVRALASAVPVTQPETVFRQSEYRLNLEFDGVLLTAIYDLIILEETRAHILDWKTHMRPPQRQVLANHWQTRLYPFVLVETSHYPAAAVDVSYWFVQQEDNETDEMNETGVSLQPQSIQFSYSDRLHRQIKQDLSQQIRQIHHWLERYRAGESLPQVDIAHGHCSTCQFALRCHRNPERESNEHWRTLDDIGSIQEINITEAQ